MKADLTTVVFDELDIVRLNRSDRSLRGIGSSMGGSACHFSPT